MGLLSGLFGGGGPQVTTQALDPATQRMQQDVYNAARNASSQPYQAYGGQMVAGADPRTMQALGQIGQLGGLAGLGGAALGGDPAALQRFMNPYQQNVIDQVGSQYDTLRAQANRESNDMATQAGAFGGSRHGIMQGARLGQLDQGQAATMAGLQQQGFMNAQNQAGIAANFGMGALGQQMAGGDYMRQIEQQRLGAQRQAFDEKQNWGVRNLDILRSGLSGTPYGQSQSTPTSSNALAGMAGGALTGFQVGGPLGAGIGAAAGLLF
jgi:hypothetical protein